MMNRIRAMILKKIEKDERARFRALVEKEKWYRIFLGVAAFLVISGTVPERVVFNNKLYLGSKVVIKKNLVKISAL